MHDTEAATKPGLLKVIVAVVAGPPNPCTGRARFEPEAGVEVNGVALVVPDKVKLKVCDPAVHCKVPGKVPAAALL